MSSMPPEPDPGATGTPPGAALVLDSYRVDGNEIPQQYRRSVRDNAEAALNLGILDEEQLSDPQQPARRLHRDQRDWGDELALPTGQIFLEALKGLTTLLEPFKLAHRGLDALSAQETRGSSALTRSGGRGSSPSPTWNANRPRWSTSTSVTRRP
jgi:hypothetical protein